MIGRLVDNGVGVVGNVVTVVKEVEINGLIIPKVYLVPKAKPRDTNVPRVLLLLVNDSPILLIPKAKPRNTNNISYYYFYSENVPNHLLLNNLL